MQYEFPIINHIDDVLPAIEGCDEIVVANRGLWTVVNYIILKSSTFPPIVAEYYSDSDTGEGDAIRDHYNRRVRRECRGLIFDNRTGNLIRRPFHKFFNYGEREETIGVDFASIPHIMVEKLDGSMIAPFIIDGEILWGTRMGVTDIADQARAWVHADSDRAERYNAFVAEVISDGYTPIFEWCSPENQIVVYHPVSNLILTALRNIETGKYIRYEDMPAYTHDNIPIVATFNSLGSTEEIVERIRSQSLEEQGEGAVAVFDGHMLKIKGDEYLRIHSAKERVQDVRHVVADILNGVLDDVLPVCTEQDRNRLIAYRDKFWDRFNAEVIRYTEDVQQRLTIYQTKKEYALGLGSDDNKFLRSMVFQLIEGRRLWASTTIEQEVKDFLFDNMSTRSKFDVARKVIKIPAL